MSLKENWKSIFSYSGNSECDNFPPRLAKGKCKSYNTDDENLATIAEFVRREKPNRVLELGTAEARTTEYLTRLIKAHSHGDNKLLITVDVNDEIDTFQGSGDNLTARLIEASRDFSDMLTIRNNRLSLLDEEESIIVLFFEGLSWRLLPDLLSTYDFDFIYEDASHLPSVLIEDWKHIARFAKRTCVVCFDDMRGNEFVNWFRVNNPDWNYFYTDVGRGQMWVERADADSDVKIDLPSVKENEQFFKSEFYNRLDAKSKNKEYKAKQIINVYWKDTDNLGDRKSGVALYFDFPLPVKCIDIKNINLSKEELENSYIIIGGGGHIHLPSPEYNNGIIKPLEELMGLSKWTTVWGIGSNIHGGSKAFFPDCLNKARLIGIRDSTSRYWVPDPSCMSPIFDTCSKDISIRNSVVYEHRDMPLAFHHISNRMMCEGAKFEFVIPFLASAKTIITNSYHGAYWGKLLGRNVIIPDPYSSKFYTIHPDINILANTPSRNQYLDVYYSSHLLTPSPFLDQCRSASTDFYNRVIIDIYKYTEE